MRRSPRIAAAAVLTLAITALTLLSPPLAYAQCGEPGNEPCDSPYRVTLYFEPDWCTYAYGDRVFVRSHVVGVTLVAYEWYVVSAGDPEQGALAASFAGDGWAVDQYVIGCGLVSLP